MNASYNSAPSLLVSHVVTADLHTFCNPQKWDSQSARPSPTYTPFNPTDSKPQTTQTPRKSQPCLSGASTAHGKDARYSPGKPARKLSNLDRGYASLFSLRSIPAPSGPPNASTTYTPQNPSASPSFAPTTLSEPRHKPRHKDAHTDEHTVAIKLPPPPPPADRSPLLSHHITPPSPHSLTNPLFAPATSTLSYDTSTRLAASKLQLAPTPSSSRSTTSTAPARGSAL